mmetsp:Transcript_146/g.380  ORF Transcript_146/g.380 Transcript_146/m.380 type:complete len:95 (-) Transcript_146:2-286(-)
MRLYALLLLLSASPAAAFVAHTKFAASRALRSDPNDDGVIDVDALVESLEAQGTKVTTDDDKPMTQEDVNKLLDAQVGSDDDPFGGIPRAKGDW